MADRKIEESLLPVLFDEQLTWWPHAGRHWMVPRGLSTLAPLGRESLLAVRRPAKNPDSQPDSHVRNLKESDFAESYEDKNVVLLLQALGKSLQFLEKVRALSE